MALNNLTSSSISDTVTMELREAILAGDFEPGARLIERHLAAQLGVSHIPVREALARLTEEGLVEREPRRGARVAELGSVELEEVSSLRSVLERFVVERVQARWQPGYEQQLRAIVGKMTEAAEARDVDELFMLDRRFHEALWGMAEHSVLADIASQLRGRINSFLKAANAALGQHELQRHVQAHEDLIVAIASGDLVAAQESMSQHIDDAVARVSSTGREGGPGGDPVTAP